MVLYMTCYSVEDVIEVSLEPEFQILVNYLIWVLETELEEQQVLLTAEPSLQPPSQFSVVSFKEQTFLIFIRVYLDFTLKDYVWVHMFAQVQMYMFRDQKSMQGIFLNCSPPYFGNQALLLNLEFFVLYIFKYQNYRYMPLCLALLMNSVD